MRIKKTGKITGIHNLDDSLCFHIVGSTEAIKEIGKMFNIEYQTNYCVYEMEDNHGTLVLTDQEMSYSKITRYIGYLTVSEIDFSAFLFFRPKTIVLIVLKTKKWKRYCDKILERFKWGK